MFLQALTLFHFRNFTEETVSFSPHINLIHGNNGQGKTNLIEAIHVLSATKSFRTSKAGELCIWGREEAGVHGKLSLSQGDVTLGIIIEKGKKKYLLDGKEVSASQFVGRLLCVTFSPQDIELVKSEPQTRRQFLDKHTVDLQPALLQYLMHYNKALKNKQVLLKTGRVQAHALDAWDKVLSDAAVEIMKVRREFIRLLQPALQETYRQFAGADGEIVISLRETIPQEELKAATIFNALIEAREDDIAQKSSRKGPHRDDLEISMGGHKARLYASQGQSKSIALALKLAALKVLEERRGEKAVFLLDDVDSELDEGRLQRLYAMIQEEERQIFVTGTEPRMQRVQGKVDGALYRIENGKIRNSDG